MTKLHEQGAGIEKLNKMVDDGEFTLEDIEDQLSLEVELFEDKGKAVAYVIENLTSDQNQLDIMIKKLQSRKSAIKANQDRLKRYLSDNMQRSGITQIKTPDITISLRKPSKRLVVDCDPMELPIEYQNTKIEANKSEIKAAMKEGEEIEGCRLEDGDFTVSIRI